MARRLLGATLATSVEGDYVAVRLTEVEAYGGATDPASHAYRSRTKRNSPMFDDAGAVYVYRSYGIHWCMNVVTGSKGSASAVLLRGGAIVAGHDTVVARRGRSDHLTDGPGKLCQALNVDGAMSGGILNEGPISLLLADEPPSDVVTSARVGISRAIERPWRFRTVGHGTAIGDGVSK